LELGLELIGWKKSAVFTIFVELTLLSIFIAESPLLFLLLWDLMVLTIEI
jgi:hypothetical protein